ncbi:MAG: hypothetical protein AAFR16_00265 [Pseudomonadota bacterium]
MARARRKRVTDGALARAVESLGSQAAAARRLGLSRSAVSKRLAAMRAKAPPPPPATARDLKRALLARAKANAQTQGVLFALSENDFEVPPRCPVLGLPLRRSEGARDDLSPSLDRLVPALGYVPGNVTVISWRANKLKADADPLELLRVARWVAAQWMARAEPKAALLSPLPRRDLEA